ncbi:MAG: hypothetical protein EOM18_01815, partial [Clostridia bacterium]|nr:hypothetical protein [Clostridia bacterium]
MIKNKKKWVALSWLMAVMMISDPFAILAESNAVLPQITAEVQENSLIGSDQAGYGASPDNSAENGAIENGSAEGGPAGNGPTENGSAESGSAANGSTENDPPTNDQPGDDPAAGGDAEGDLDQPQQGSEGDANGETGSGPEDVLQGGQDDSLEDQENIESIEITEFETCVTIVIVPGTLQEELMLPDYILATDSLGQNVEVPVTWECENYLPEEKGCYDFQAVFPEEQYVISCEIPTIMVIVAVTCTCRDESGELVGVHDPENQACVLYGEEAVILTMPDGTVLITSASDAEIYMAAGAVLVSKVMSARATEGENSLLMMNYMQAEIDEISAKADTEIYNTGIITGQEASDIGLSYAWWKYVNRIWKYKALDKFSWTVDPKDSLGNVLKKWGGTASFMPASAEHLPENEPDVIPTSSISGKTITYTVYYGEQLRYALEHEAVNKIKTYTQIVINLQNDINLDGATQNWTTVSLYQAGYPRLQINGNNHTIYNFGKFHQKNESGVIGTTPENNQYHGAGMVIATGGMEVSDIKFESVMIVASKDSKAPSVGILGKTEAAIGNWAIRKPSTISNVTIDHSLFYSGMQESNVSPMGVFNLNTNNMGGKPAIRGATVTQCSLEGNYIYGGNHAAGLTVGNYMGTTSNTYVIDTLIATYGGHSGGFMSCNVGSVDSFHHTLAEGESGIATITNCFAEVDMYAAVDSGGFVGLFSGDITNCFSTGKLEGFCRCGGFSSATSNSGVYGNANITRCYSTTLVGLREESQYMGGFHSTATMGQYPRLTNYKFTDCYAAGEVGDINVSASDSATAQEVRHDGGFFSSVESGRGTNDVTAGNCYYDKQTTAMREKMVAEYQYGNTVPSQVGNVSGVLTSQYQKKDGTVVYGLASGTYDAGATEGFRGFSDNSHWSYQSGYYPQLNVFANASVGNGWNAKQCQTAASYSKASASTAALNNWAEGYTWSSLGVRSSDDTIMDHTSGNHKLGKESYDTVRSMTTDARLTASSAFTSRFGDTKTVDMTDKRTGTTEKVSSFTYENASHHLAMITNPGMDWADVKDSSGSGKRVMRLISVMAVGAGSDQYVYAGTKYDHRADVSLTGSISVVPNLVVG